jgi:hypothetical protein
MSTSSSIYDYLTINTPFEFSNKVGLNSMEPHSRSYESFEIYDHDFFNAVANSPKKYKQAVDSDLVIIGDSQSGTSLHPTITSLLDDKYATTELYQTLNSNLHETSSQPNTHIQREGFVTQDPHFSDKEMFIREYTEDLLSNKHKQLLGYSKVKSCGACQFSNGNNGSSPDKNWDLTTKIYISSLTVVGLYIFFRTLQRSG